MKVLLVNGSPHPKGCTYTALNEIKTTLIEEGIEAEIYWISNEAIHGCIGCFNCYSSHQCAIDDKVNEFADLATKADGFVFGTPVHYAAACGGLTSFMDRLFYSAGRNFYLKPGAAIVSARRAGTTAAFEQLNKYFTICQMPIISSQYWNMVHGSKPEDVLQDEEGMQCMRTLAHNMAFFLKCKEAGLKNGVELPKREKPIRTNFIR